MRVVLYLVAVIIFSAVVCYIVYSWTNMLSSAEFSSSDPSVIMKAEKMLQTIGMNPGIVDGNADPMLKEAIKEFQTLHELEVNGEIDESLFYELTEFNKLMSGN